MTMLLPEPPFDVPPDRWYAAQPTGPDTRFDEAMAKGLAGVPLGRLPAWVAASPAHTEEYQLRYAMGASLRDQPAAPPGRPVEHPLDAAYAHGLAGRRIEDVPGHRDLTPEAREAYLRGVREAGAPVIGPPAPAPRPVAPAEWRAGPPPRTATAPAALPRSAARGQAAPFPPLPASPPVRGPATASGALDRAASPDVSPRPDRAMEVYARAYALSTRRGEPAGTWLRAAAERAAASPGTPGLVQVFARTVAAEARTRDRMPTGQAEAERGRPASLTEAAAVAGLLRREMETVTVLSRPRPGDRGLSRSGAARLRPSPGRTAPASTPAPTASRSPTAPAPQPHRTAPRTRPGAH
ncbi:hypothetical protein [Streptomyces lichenis]|uniref:Uncharacterized protein n=1 Tax=Streptomyces lichenis TaxID=2306967 RepID=A0ABT0IA69_9ACTN|nr:hypothetical protein [Streptomyces lichenis]MCK8678223.1 hypothetical protein [Streptomyces lichenis]